jgi:hypothetical protein
MGLGGKSEKCKFPKRHKMQRSFTCGSETMGDRVKQIIPRRVFMSGKVTPEIIKYLSHPKYSEILFSYPPYNQCDELVQGLECCVKNVKEPFYTISHHDTIAKLVLDPQFASFRRSAGMKELKREMDLTVLLRATGNDGRDGKVGKIVALREFLKLKGYKEHADCIKVYQEYMSNIPKEVTVDLKTCSEWQSTIPGIHAGFRDMLEYDDILGVFGPGRITVAKLVEMKFLNGNEPEIKSTLSWLAKTFIIIRVPGSMVDLLNFLRAIYSTTKFANLSMEELIAKIMADKFVLPDDAWVPDEVFADGEVDDDLAILLRLLVSKRELILTLQVPLDAPSSVLVFYDQLPNTKVTKVFDSNSKNLDKILAKGY